MTPEERHVAPFEGLPDEGELEKRTTQRPVSVNWHVWPRCNYRCSFCYGTFEGISQTLPREYAIQVPRLLRAAGTEKINFAGGEPTLCPHLPDLLRTSREEGLVTMIVTNATRLTDDYLDHIQEWTDWIAISVDSVSSAVEAYLGRGYGDHVELAKAAARRVKARGIQLKINTTVTGWTWQEDMHSLLQELAPDRWKVFQVLRIRGENDHFDPHGWITREQFQDFLRKHADLRPVGEDNEDMTGSYLMLDPLGRFFQNFAGVYTSSESILKIGVEEALGQVGWDRSKFVRRGGLYDWSQRTRRG